MTSLAAFKLWWNISRGLLGRRHCTCHNLEWNATSRVEWHLEWNDSLQRLNECVKGRENERGRENTAKPVILTTESLRQCLVFYGAKYLQNLKVRKYSFVSLIQKNFNSIQVDPLLRITPTRPTLSGWPHCHPNKIRETCHRVHEVGTRRVKHSFMLHCIALLSRCGIYRADISDDIKVFLWIYVLASRFLGT